MRHHSEPFFSFAAIADAEENDSRSHSDDDEEHFPEVIIEFLEARTYRLECPLEDMHAPETCHDLKKRLARDRYFMDHIQHMPKSDQANKLVNPPNEDPCARVLCFKGTEFCIKYDEFCIKMMNVVLQMMNVVLKMMNFVLKMMNL